MQQKQLSPLEQFLVGNGTYVGPNPQNANSTLPYIGAKPPLRTDPVELGVREVDPNDDKPPATLYIPGTKEVSDNTKYPVVGSKTDVVQNNKKTPGTGNSTYTNEQVADTFNALNGKPSEYSSGDSFEGVLGQFMRDRVSGEGLYKIDPSKRFSPEQIQSHLESADNFYENTLSNLVAKERTKAATAATLGDLNSRQSSVAQQINNSLDANPITKQYVELQSQYNNMINTVGRGDGASDIATIYTFMKALDPDSVVRETEYDTGANKTGNIFKGYLAKFNGMIDPNGGFVSPEAKQNILQAIKDRFGVKGQQYKNFRDQKVKQLEMRGVPNASDYITQYDFTFDPDADKAQVTVDEDTMTPDGVNPLWNF